MKSSSQTAFLYIYKSESDRSWMDKLFPHRKHEDIHERIWTMAAPQDKSNHNQAVEKANENLYESAVERHIKYTKKIKLNARRHNVKFRSIQII